MTKRARCVGGPKDGQEHEGDDIVWSFYTTRELAAVRDIADPIPGCAVEAVRHIYEYKNGVWAYGGEG